MTTTETMWANDAASQALGIRLLDVTPGRCVAVMTVRDDMINGVCTCHGAFVAALADTAFAFACNSRGVVTVASGFDIAFLEPVSAGEVLRAEAVERTLRGRTGIYDVTVSRVVDGGAGTVVAEFRGRSRALSREA